MLKCKGSSLLIMLLISLLIFIVPVSAADHHVYSGQSIQSAIDSAADGDTVYVHAGTYSENITLKDGVSLTGDGKASTFIDGGGSGTVVTADGVTCTITGLTIQNGNLSGADGAGMWISDSSITLEDCAINDNSARWGGGMWIENNSSVTIINCDFINNFAYYGGGIYCEDPGSYISVDGCLFDSNIVEDSGYGGAMYLDLSSNTETITITNSTIRNNVVGTCGGGIYCDGDATSDFSIEYCYFYNNSVNYDGCIPTGGAIYLANLSSATVKNCIIYDNEAADTSGEGWGGAIYLYQVPSSYFYNCTLYNNISGQYGYGIYGFNSTCEVVNCILWDDPHTEIHGIGSNINISYSNIDDGDYNGYYNNITWNPSFVDPENGDLHLKSDSHCIDAGTTIAQVADDIDGDERPQDAAYDIGADEYAVYEKDLSVKKTVSFPWIFAGRTAHFTITVTNNGPGDATGVEVIDNMPAGLTYDYSIASQGTYNGITWTVGDLAEDAQATLQIFVRTNARGEFINTATVSGNEDDSVTGNNVDQAMIYVFNPRSITYTSLVLVNQNYAETMYSNIMQCLPEVVDTEVQVLLDDIQSHMVHASALTNTIYASGQLYQAVALMQELEALLE